MNARALPPVVLSGAMGTGKSTVGRQVADALGRAFFDVDTAIEERAHKTCGQILRDDGAAAFRRLEREVAEELLFAGFDAPKVVALGGGTLCDHGDATAPGDRLAFARRVHQECTSVLLDVDPNDQQAWETLQARTSADTADRPLLALDGRALLTARLDAYRHAFLRVNPLRATDVVVADVLSLVNACESLRAQNPAPLAVRSPSGSYPVWCTNGGLAHLADALFAAGLRPTSALVVTSPAIAVHAEAARQSLSDAGIQVHLVNVPEGEAHKTVQTLESLWDAAASARLGRDDVVVAVGGGVIGDMAGFCAATYMRGTPVVQVPTTLLSMVDASVGGKVAVDRPQGKNLVGHFWSPSAVLVDVDTLKTLPREERRAGLSEALKHAYLSADEGLRTDIRAFAPAFVAESDALCSPDLLRKAIAVKRDIVEADPFERGVRATLNFGHTFAHALEKIRGYSYRHGDAVAVGMRAAAHFGHALGKTPKHVVDAIESDLDVLGLDQTADGLAATALADAMLGDKKQAKGKLRLIVLEDFGRAVFVDDPGEKSRERAWRSVGAQ